MTNNQTIDGVSREDLESAYDELTDWKSPVAQKLRAILDAPAVERQDASVNWQAVATEQMSIIEQRQSSIAQLQARIAELESGSGEPCVWVDAELLQISANEKNWVRISGSLKENRTHRHTVPLYTAPPAPVAVVLPDLSELRGYHAKAVENLTHYADDSGLRESDVKHYRKRAEFHAECLSRIDATAALNGVRK